MARKNKNTAQPSVAALTRELDTINIQLKEAYDRFNYTYESELIDACIYEIAALRARYNYVLRCIKELSGGSKRPVPHAVPVIKNTETGAPVEEQAAAASVMKGGPICPL